MSPSISTSPSYQCHQCQECYPHRLEFKIHSTADLRCIQCHIQGWRIGTSEPIFWLLSQANIGQNQLNNNREIAVGCTNPPALVTSITRHWMHRRSAVEFIRKSNPLLSLQLATAAAAESAAVTAAAVVTATSGMAPCLPMPPMPPAQSPVGPIGPAGSVAVIMEEEDKGNKEIVNVTVNSNCGNDSGDRECDGDGSPNAANNLGIGQ